MAAALGAAEALGSGDLRCFAHHGDLVGAAVVTGEGVVLPREALDSIADCLGGLEQAAYFHLVRLSFGCSRNFCRVPKRELQARLRMPERRINRILDELGRAGLVRALHRDNRGTLYRVFLPAEVEGRQPSGVTMGVPCGLPETDFEHRAQALPALPARKAGPQQ
jgi:hypothetical protein